MNLSFGKARHGWLPVQLTVDSTVFEILASRLWNDPVNEFLAAAIWVLEPDFVPSTPSFKADPPLSGGDFRCAHLCEERRWHTLKIRRVERSDLLWLTFYVDHYSVSQVYEDELRFARFPLFEYLTAASFVRAVHDATVDVLKNHTLTEWDKKWGRPVDWSLFAHVSALVDVIDWHEDLS